MNKKPTTFPNFLESTKKVSLEIWFIFGSVVLLLLSLYIDSLAIIKTPSFWIPPQKTQIVKKNLIKR